MTAHQNADGSWGGPWAYFHDRLISTLRVILTLNGWHLRRGDRLAIERGIRYIWQNAARLTLDPYETVAFELIFPTLLAEAETQGLALPYAAFDHVTRQGREKLARVGVQMMYRRETPLATSVEALGANFERDNASGLQEASGAVAISPGATAFLLQQWPDNDAARAYLSRVMQEGPGDGGAPSVFPIETFERAWSLYHLLAARPSLQDELKSVIAPLLDFLYRTMKPSGWATSEFFTIKEADSTAICFARC